MLCFADTRKILLEILFCILLERIVFRIFLVPDLLSGSQQFAFYISISMIVDFYFMLVEPFFWIWLGWNSKWVGWASRNKKLNRKTNQQFKSFEQVSNKLPLTNFHSDNSHSGGLELLPAGHGTDDIDTNIDTNFRKSQIIRKPIKVNILHENNEKFCYLPKTEGQNMKNGKISQKPLIRRECIDNRPVCIYVHA